MVQSYTPDVALVLTMIFQVNIKGGFVFDVISFGGKGFKKCGIMFCFKMLQHLSAVRR